MASTHEAGARAPAASSLSSAGAAGMGTEGGPPARHIRERIARITKEEAKLRPKVLCSICGATKKNSASINCSVCGPVCLGCDLKNHETSLEDGPATDSAGPRLTPACYLLVHSVSKGANIGNMIRSCVAFGVDTIVVAGSNKIKSFGCQGADVYIKFKYFPNLADACQFLRADRGCEIVGVEICEGARALPRAPFKGPTAFLLGNEGDGLTPREMGLCDWFTYIPQHGVGTASLNVAVAASIALYQFATWAQYAEASREGYKYVVAPRPQRTGPRNNVPSATPREKRSARQAELADPGSLHGGAATAGETAQAADGSGH